MAWVLALAMVLCAAAWLRFSGLSWGLRHPVHIDERVYVENVAAMVAAGDWDHRLYTYPGGFFYLLAPVVRLAGASPLNPTAYLLCRGLVATVGVLNVGLAYVVGARLIGPWAGLGAAVFLAVSPVDVRTCHQVRPDILLEGAGLLGVLAWRRAGESSRWDALEGALIGAATAVKFTGALMLPSFVLARVLVARRRVWGVVLAAVVAAVVVVILTPYAVVHWDEYVRGPLAQLDMYYKGKSKHGSFGDHLEFYLGAAQTAVGPVGAVLVALGAVAALRTSWRNWTPALLHPVVTLLVMSSAALTFPRLILPAMGVVYLLGGWGLQIVRARSGLAAVAVLAASAYVPALESKGYVDLVSQPRAHDLALDWIDAHAAPGARVLETRPEADWTGRAGAAVGVDPAKYDLVSYVEDLSRRDLRALCLLALEADVVITGPGEGRRWGRLQTLFRASDRETVLQLKAPPRKPSYVTIDLAETRLTASENLEALSSVRDGRATTAWVTSGPMAGSEWLQVEFAQPVVVGRVTLQLPRKPTGYEPETVVAAASREGSSLQTVASLDLRSPLSEQLAPGEVSQVLLLDPQPVVALRVAQVGVRAEPWAIAELRIERREDALADACPSRQRD